MNDVVISIKNLSKHYFVYKSNIKRVLGVIFGRKPDEVKKAINNVTFDIHKGERVMIVGKIESGCSTMLRMINGVTFPTSGKIKTKGSMMGIMNIAAGFDNEFTSRENVYLKANAVGLSREMVQEHEAEILDFADATDFADIPMKRAPRGANTRMALAVQLLADVDILVVDENFSIGGKRSRVKCEERLKKYLEEHPDVTLVFTTSQVPFAASICERGIVLDKGNIVYDGPSDEARKVFKELTS